MTVAGSGPFPAPPRFDVVLRGYDRIQVEDHIAQLHGMLARLQADLGAARQQLARTGPPPARPAEPAAEMVASISGRMQSMMNAAQADADEVRRRARAEAEQLAKAAQTQLAELKSQRDALLGELARLRAEADHYAAHPQTALRPGATSPHAGPGPGAPVPHTGHAPPRAGALFESPTQAVQGEPPAQRAEPALATDEAETTVTMRATTARAPVEVEATVMLPAAARKDGAADGASGHNGDGANPAGLAGRRPAPPRRSRAG